MNMKVKRWAIAKPITDEVDIALKEYDPIIRQILFNRGIATQLQAENFINAKLPPDTDPYNLLTMAEAVDRVLQGIENNESIAIYGDYDVDGVSATALLTQSLKLAGAQVESYIPDRFEEGYGLNPEAIKYLKDQGIQLVITVDCGIRALEEVDYANQLGLDMIITDHHRPGENIPEAVAVINPRQFNDPYPEKDLAGVGLAYKLVCALDKLNSHSNGKSVLPNPDNYLDFVALGTVADLAPLQGENRSLVRTGIIQMRNTNRPGLKALIGVSGQNRLRINSSSIGYILGPRLNAAGRLDNAKISLDLLLTESQFTAGLLAQKLENSNRERQRRMREQQQIAEQLMKKTDPDIPFIFVHGSEYDQGIIGLVASRLTEKYYKPSIVISQSEEISRGSCRSIPEFHITNALEECSDLLVRYGGHSAAAGFSIKNDQIQDLFYRMKVIAEKELDTSDLRETIQADIYLQLSDLNFELIEKLEHLQPTGRGNPPAQFASFAVRVLHSRTVGKEKQHLKLILSDGHITYDAIAFRQGYWQDVIPDFINIIYTFELNEYNGRSTLQLNIKDIKPGT
jgi:single-stranded-DNA-specific exonuclease